MHCFISTFDLSDKIITLPEDELKHFKVLRIRENEKILITNGERITALCNSTQNNEFLPLEFFYDHNEPQNNLTVALSIIQDRSRLEYAVEKLVEIGVSKILLIQTRFTQKTNINLDRLNKKAKSALKQSNRSRLIEIKGPIKLAEIEPNNDTSYFIASKDGQKIINGISDSFCFIGPEAGFDKNEINYITKTFMAKEIKLANSILRTETAAVLMAGKLIGLG